VIGYVIAYQPSAKIIDDDSWLPNAKTLRVADASTRKIMSDTNTILLAGLEASAEYVAAVLPRNKFGWGHRWSEPLFFHTASDTLPPVAQRAPSVHPVDEQCNDVAVQLPAVSDRQCRRPSEFLVQLRSGDGTDEGVGSWATIRRSTGTPTGETVHVRAAPSTGAFQIRLLAGNAKGLGAPSPPTTVRRDPAGKRCISELDLFVAPNPPSPPEYSNAPPPMLNGTVTFATTPLAALCAALALLAFLLRHGGHQLPWMRQYSKVALTAEEEDGGSSSTCVDIRSVLAGHLRQLATCVSSVAGVKGKRKASRSSRKSASRSPARKQDDDDDLNTVEALHLSLISMQTQSKSDTTYAEDCGEPELRSSTLPSFHSNHEDEDATLRL
jgi:hypothetical protein